MTLSAQTGPYAISDELVQFQAERVKGHGHIVLFVDDEEMTLRSLAHLFRNDYEVWTAISAEVAIEKLAKSTPEKPVCAIVSDQRMPGMKGHEFFAAIRQKYPLALRMMMTGYADINAVIDSINDGRVFNYIRKPWDQEDFDKKLSNAVAMSVLMQRFSIPEPSIQQIEA